MIEQQPCDQAAVAAFEMEVWALVAELAKLLYGQRRAVRVLIALRIVDADKYAARLREEIHVAKSHAEEAKQSALTVQAEAKLNKAEAERLIAENTEKQQALDARTAKFKSGLLELQREFGDDGHKLSVPPFTEGELQALEQKPMQAN